MIFLVKLESLSHWWKRARGRMELEFIFQVRIKINFFMIFMIVVKVVLRKSKQMSSRRSGHSIKLSVIKLVYGEVCQI